MKRYLAKLFTSFFFLGVFLIGPICYTIHSASERYSLDRLFPENWYTKAKESCAQVCESLGDLLSTSGTSLQKILIIDVSIGRLVFAGSCIDRLTKENPAVPHDDLIYLSRVVATVDQLCGRLPGTLEPDRVQCLKNIVADVRKKLEQLMAKKQLVNPSQ